MGIQLDRNARLLGVPMVKARNVLKAWSHGASRNASDIASRSDVKLTVPETMMLLQEFVERGLTETALVYPDFPQYGFRDQLSEAGKAFVGASGRKRTDREKAQVILEGVLRSCAELAADPDAPYHVAQVWLYGSMLGNSPDVGDVDIVITKEWSPKYLAIKDRETRHRAARDYAADRVAPSTLQGIMGSLFAADTLFMRSVFGERKHPLLSVGSLDDMINLACRCQVVYDSARGGRVHDPAIAKHPEAGERGADVDEPRVMPGLSPSKAALRPLSTGWMPHLEIHRDKNIDLSTFPPDHANYRLNYPGQGECHFYGSAAELKKDFSPSVLFGRAGTDDLDGIDKALLVLSYYHRSPSLVVKVGRTIDDAPDAPSYAMDLAWHEKRGLEQGHYVNAVQGIMALAAADIVRLSRRLTERGNEGPIKVDIKMDGEGIEDIVYWTLYHPLTSGRWLSAMPDAEFGRLDISFSTPDGPIVLKRMDDGPERVEDSVGPAP